MPTGKRKEPMPTEEEPPKPMRLLSPEEIEDHRQFVEDEEPGVGSEAYLRFLPAADAEQIRSITRGIDVKKLKQKSKELLEKYDAQGYVEVPDVVVPPAALMPPTTPPGQVARKIDFESVRLKIGELMDKLDAQGYPVAVDHPAFTTPPRRVSEERVKRLRRFMEQSFRLSPRGSYARASSRNRRARSSGTSTASASRRRRSSRRTRRRLCRSMTPRVTWSAPSMVRSRSLSQAADLVPKLASNRTNLLRTPARTTSRYKIWGISKCPKFKPKCH
jgi:hypothetical protein